MIGTHLILVQRLYDLVRISCSLNDMLHDRLLLHFQSLLGVRSIKALSGIVPEVRGRVHQTLRRDITLMKEYPKEMNQFSAERRSA